VEVGVVAVVMTTPSIGEWMLLRPDRAALSDIEGV
jgi:hypothetical protein